MLVSTKMYYDEAFIHFSMDLSFAYNPNEKGTPIEYKFST